MPPKRRAAEVETPNDPNNAPLGRPDVLVPAEQPAPVKRQRVSRACDQCRAARERCDGKQPQCYPCISQSRPCTYEVSPKKRGVQTGYIRTLELALGWVFEKVPGSEDTLSALLAHGGGQGQTILTGKDPGGADRLQKRWRKSRVHRGIDRILSGEAATSPGQGRLSPSADASDIEGDAARTRANPESVAPDTETLTQASSSSHPMSSTHHPPITPSDEPSAAGRPRQMPLSGMSECPQVSPGRLKLPPDHWRLLDVYFSYTHSWLPILEKQDLFQASYLYPDHGLEINPRDASSAVHAELWAALAVASFQDAASSNPPTADYTDPASTSSSNIYGTARGLLPSEQGPFQVHHARAYLLLSLVNLGQDKLTAAGLLTGSAIRILLDPDTTQRGIQDRDGQKISLALMSCFLLDTILSIRCNRPPHLRAEDLAAVPLASESGPDQWEPWTACDGFGPDNVGSRSSRSPAFCLSTFNLLFAVVKVIGKELSLKRQGSLPREGSGTLVTQLQQAIDPRLPFGNFIVSPTCGSASVPTPYLARAIYLWASALAAPDSDTLLPLLQDTLDHHQRLFGRPSTPPFISACIACFANEEHLLRCSERNRDTVRVLVSSYSPRRQFGDKQPSSVHGSHHSALFRPTQSPLDSPTQFSPPSNPAMHHATPAVPSLYNNPTASQRHEPHTPSRGYDSFLALGMAGSYPIPFTNSLATMSQGSNLHIQHPGTGIASAMPDMATGMASAQRNPPSHRFIPPSGFGPSPDFDALLDDLASIECGDAVDVDAQFMANLGFAPGCDITEILTRGFGGV
jgi:hypothetical protein